MWQTGKKITYIKLNKIQMKRWIYLDGRVVSSNVVRVKLAGYAALCV
jgi:hypothetical protein